MNTLRSLTFGTLFLLATNLFAQSSDFNPSLHFKLQMMADNQTWGVFVIPDASIKPSTITNTGSGQVTIVAPIDFTYSSFKYHAGAWVENARVNGPVEAPGKAYISFGFVMDEPRINLYPNEETLLFTFTCSSQFDSHLSLINNENDPFAAPNSFSSNPGNDLGIIDMGTASGMAVYAYAGNIESSNSIFSKRETRTMERSNRTSEVITTGGNGTRFAQPNE